TVDPEDPRTTWHAALRASVGEAPPPGSWKGARVAATARACGVCRQAASRPPRDEVPVPAGRGADRRQCRYRHAGNPGLRRERLLPLIVASALFIENMESTAIATSLPQIAADLGVEPVVLKLALTAYMLALAVFIPISGWMADRFGSRTTCMSAIAVFLCGSLACAASQSLGMLVAARFLQGTGGAMMVPVGRLVLLRSIEKSRLVRALSWLTVPALMGPVLGPVVGGLITAYSHWRLIFLVKLPVGLLGIWLAWRYIPQLHAPVARLDWMGFFLSGLGLASAMFGLSMLGRQLGSTALLLGVSVVGLCLLVMYALHARRHP